MPIDAFNTVQRVFFFGLLAGVTLWLLWILRDFLMPIFWAVVFAVLLYPAFQHLHAQFRFRGGKSAAALATILVVLIVVLAPLYGLGALVVNEAVGVYEQLSGQGPTFLGAIEAIPYLSDALSLFNIEVTEARETLVEAGRGAGSWLASEAFSIGIQTFGTIVKFLIMLYLLFFFLRDGDRLGAYIMRLIPLGNTREHALFERFASTTRAIVKGTIIVSIVQGVLGAILFSIVGIPNAILWGAVMAFAALIPALGPGIVWIPAGIILLLMGDVWQGVVVLAGGAVLIGLVDNILRPVLVGRDTEMPDALILLAILGGIISFGIAGIVIGPVVAALALAMWSLFEHEYDAELTARG